MRARRRVIRPTVAVVSASGSEHRSRRTRARQAANTVLGARVRSPHSGGGGYVADDLFLELGNLARKETADGSDAVALSHRICGRCSPPCSPRRSILRQGGKSRQRSSWGSGRNRPATRSPTELIAEVIREGLWRSRSSLLMSVIIYRPLHSPVASPPIAAPSPSRKVARRGTRGRPPRLRSPSGPDPTRPCRCPWDR